MKVHRSRASPSRRNLTGGEGHGRHVPLRVDSSGNRENLAQESLVLFGLYAQPPDFPAGFRSKTCTATPFQFTLTAGVRSPRQEAEQCLGTGGRGEAQKAQSNARLSFVSSRSYRRFTTMVGLGSLARSIVLDASSTCARDLSSMGVSRVDGCITSSFEHDIPFSKRHPEGLGETENHLPGSVPTFLFRRN